MAPCGRPLGARDRHPATLSTLRRFAQLVAVGILSSCAVGTALDEGLPPDTTAPDSDASTDAEAIVDSAPPDDTSPDDASPSPPDADAGAPDTARRPDTAPPPDTGPPDTGSTCATAGFSGALVKFDLSSQPGSETSAAATSTATGVTATALSRSAGLTATTGSGSMNSSNWPSIVDATRYYHFSIAPPAGCTVALTTLAVDFSASGSGPTTADVATSMDNFAAHKGSMSASGSGSISLAGVGGTAVIEVRVYGYGASSAAGTFRIQNTLTLSGTLN
jgi:hypothetical protein